MRHYVNLKKHLEVKLMDIIKNLEPSTVALLGDLHKPYSVYNNLKELANLPNDPKSRNLFLIYKFFVTELAEKGQLTDDKIDETVHDCIMWFVSNPMSSYYKSAVFERVLIKVGELPLSTEIKQVENKLKMVSRNVSSLQDALSLIRKLR